jgi:hypothetical protein
VVAVVEAGLVPVVEVAAAVVRVAEAEVVVEGQCLLP